MKKKILVLLLVASINVIPIFSQVIKSDTTFIFKKNNLFFNFKKCSLIEQSYSQKNVFDLSLKKYTLFNFISPIRKQNNGLIFIRNDSRDYYFDVNDNLADLRLGIAMYQKIHRPKYEYALIAYKTNL